MMNQPALAFLGSWSAEIVDHETNEVVCLVLGSSRTEVEDRSKNIKFLLEAEASALAHYRLSLSSVFINS